METTAYSFTNTDHVMYPSDKHQKPACQQRIKAPTETRTQRHQRKDKKRQHDKQKTNKENRSNRNKEIILEEKRLRTDNSQKEENYQQKADNTRPEAQAR